MAKYNFDSLNPFQPYYKLEKCYKNQQVLDILLYQKQEQQNNGESSKNNTNNDQFIQKIKQILEKSIQNSNIKVFSQFQKRGSFYNHDFLSLFIAFDQKEFPNPTDLVKKIIEVINQETENMKITEQCCKIFEKISMKEFEQPQNNEENVHIPTDEDIIARLTKESTFEQNNTEESNSSFEGQSYQDTEESQQDQNVQEQNKALRQENDKLKQELLLLRQQMYQQQEQNHQMQQSSQDNIQIILDQKKIMDKFQQEYKHISQENSILLQQSHQKQNEMNQLQQKCDQLSQQLQYTLDKASESEVNFNKNLEEKQQQLNKFVTYFLIGENKGKCYSNDRVKQRTWEIQESLKEGLIKKQLRDILQLQ